MAGEIYINPWGYNCLYFCPRCYQGYKDNVPVEKVCARYLEINYFLLHLLFKKAS